MNDVKQKNGCGCFLGDKFFNAIFYVDNIILLCSSVRKMQKIINIYFLFGFIKVILYNSSKTCYFCANFFSYNNDVHFDTRGVKFNSSNTLKYLGLKFVIKKKFFCEC